MLHIFVGKFCWLCFSWDYNMLYTSVAVLIMRVHHTWMKSSFLFSPLPLLLVPIYYQAKVLLKVCIAERRGRWRLSRSWCTDIVWAFVFKPLTVNSRLGITLMESLWEFQRNLEHLSILLSFDAVNSLSPLSFELIHY